MVPWAEVSQWAAAQQRGFQNAMARALQAIRDGEPRALWLLCISTAAYGVVHAIGPGHGKVLLGGAAFASGATFRRLATLTLASSLAQSATAILLVGALVFGARMGSGETAELTETWLAPLSIAAIGAIGALLIWRGARSFGRLTVPAETHACGCGHAHGPTVQDVTSLETFRDAAALVGSIAIRPCTGALFVLVIAARFDAFAAGCLAVLTMGLGTAAFNLIVAGGGTVARRLALLGQGAESSSALLMSAFLHIVGGGVIVTFSFLTLLA
ncbi:hypothetical protein AAFO92_07570 [Roseovarius sp. CAU 1744]|uniref:nickel/cobalt transporter n=1 Tax=Roseovarius sp. CAU 1744 TaxID=3140368 RepID=UPI00325C0416